MMMDGKLEMALLKIQFSVNVLDFVQVDCEESKYC
jgi:hypothetical protein